MIKVSTEITASDNSSPGSTILRSVYSATGNPKSLEIVFSANDTKLIFNSTSSSSPDYGLTPSSMILLADGNLDVEFTVNEGDANENVWTQRLVSGVPLMLGSLLSYDVSSISGGVVTFTTPAERIEKIRVDNPDASTKNLKFIYQ